MTVPIKEIYISYWSIKDSGENAVQKCARCGLEIETLIKRISWIKEQLRDVSSKNDVDVSMCIYYQESFFQTIYAIRERMWDIAAQFAKVERKPTGDNKFRKTVLNALERDFPNIALTLKEALSVIQKHMPTRNAAMHETFLFHSVVLDRNPRRYNHIEDFKVGAPFHEEVFPDWSVVEKALIEYIETSIKEMGEISWKVMKFVSAIASVVKPLFRDKKSDITPN